MHFCAHKFNANHKLNGECLLLYYILPHHSLLLNARYNTIWQLASCFDTVVCHVGYDAELR
jgi:hypothetical protein